MAFLIGLECAGDRSCTFLLELVQLGKVFVAFRDSIFVEFNFATIPRRSCSSFGLNTCGFHVAA